MDKNKYIFSLGKLASNLQSLEFILRAYLQQLPNSRPIGIPKVKDIYQYPVGSELPESEITSYDTLKDLINKHNQWAFTQGEQEIDESIVEVRDALAHGRVSASSPNDSLRLMKFSRPVNGKLRVVFNEMLSVEYLNRQIERVHKAIMIVNAKLES